MYRLLMMLAGIGVAGLACGCGQSTSMLVKQQGEEYAAPPPDLTVDLIVLAAPDPGTSTEEPPALPLRSGRYIVFPDGTLRQGFSRTREPANRMLPARVRTLDQQQIASLWELLHHHDLLVAHDEAGEPVSEPLLQQPAEGALHVLTVSGGGRRWSLTERVASPGEVDQSRLLPVIDSLAALAWVDTQTPPRRMVIPRRYDFGPDPYDRYREQPNDGSPEQEQRQEAER